MIGSEGAARVLSAVRSRRDIPRSQDGFSLIEILICVMLISTVILALAAGMLTLVKTTGATSERQRIQLALGSLTESLKTSPYLECGSASDYQTSYSSWPEAWTPEPSTNMSIAVTDVEYWDDAASLSAPAVPNSVPGAFDSLSTCPGGDQGTQRLTVEVSLPSGRSGTAQVVKAAA